MSPVSRRLKWTGKSRPEFDFCSEMFNATKALSSSNVVLPYPKAKTYNNLAEYYSRTFGSRNFDAKEESVSKKKSSEQTILKRNYSWYYSTLGLEFDPEQHLPSETNTKKFKKGKQQICMLNSKTEGSNGKVYDLATRETFSPLKSQKIIKIKCDILRYSRKKCSHIISNAANHGNEQNELTREKLKTCDGNDCAQIPNETVLKQTVSSNFQYTKSSVTKAKCVQMNSKSSLGKCLENIEKCSDDYIRKPEGCNSNKSYQSVKESFEPCGSETNENISYKSSVNLNHIANNEECTADITRDNSYIGVPGKKLDSSSIVVKGNSNQCMKTDISLNEKTIKFANNIMQSSVAESFVTENLVPSVEGETSLDKKDSSYLNKVDKCLQTDPAVSDTLKNLANCYKDDFLLALAQKVIDKYRAFKCRNIATSITGQENKQIIKSVNSELPVHSFSNSDISFNPFVNTDNYSHENPLIKSNINSVGKQNCEPQSVKDKVPHKNENGISEVSELCQPIVKVPSISEDLFVPKEQTKILSKEHVTSGKNILESKESEKLKSILCKLKLKNKVCQNEVFEMSGVCTIKKNNSKCVFSPARSILKSKENICLENNHVIAVTEDEVPNQDLKSKKLSIFTLKDKLLQSVKKPSICIFPDFNKLSNYKIPRKRKNSDENDKLKKAKIV